MEDTEKKLGKIDKCHFGIGGYNDAMLGLHLSFTGGSWGVGTTISAWDAETIKHSDYCKWTEADRSKQYDEIMRKLSLLLKQAKVDKVEDLKGIPVEIEFDGNMFKSFRILEEVL